MGCALDAELSHLGRLASPSLRDALTPTPLKTPTRFQITRQDFVSSRVNFYLQNCTIHIKKGSFFRFLIGLETWTINFFHST